MIVPVLAKYTVSPLGLKAGDASSEGPEITPGAKITGRIRGAVWPCNGREQVTPTTNVNKKTGFIKISFMGNRWTGMSLVRKVENPLHF